jgi:hypothetical protein
MPEKYRRIKEEYRAKGLSKKAAEKVAARIYNAQRKPGQKPVTRGGP